MPSQVTLKANGLNFGPNNLSLPQGSLLVADDVIIRRDDTLESRRGFKEYSEGIGSSVDRMKQLIEYKGRVLVNYLNKLAFDTTVLNSAGYSVFDDFSGTYSEAQEGLRIKSIEANKNLYFTTSEGIKKISARTADDFTTDANFIKNAGAVQAEDFTVELDIAQGETSGFLPPDSTVAYRIVWGYKDLNDNLILGVPSDRVAVYNFLLNQMAMDFNQLLLVLDEINQGACLINDGDYATSYYTPITSDGQTILNNVLGLATKLDTDILLGNTGGAPLTMSTFAMDSAGTVTLTFSAGDPSLYITPSDYINLQGFSTPTAHPVVATFGSPTSFACTAHGFTTGQTVVISGTTMTPDINGPHIVTVTGANSFTVPFATTAAANSNGFAAYTDLTQFNNSFQVTAVTSTTVQFIYPPATGGATPIATTPVSVTSTLNSYNYTRITETGDSEFTTPLNTLALSIPPTSEQLRTINENIFRISERLKIELNGVIPTALQTEFVTPYILTEEANTKLTITIPTTIDSDYFVQVYRTRVFTADGVQSLGDNGGIPVVADDEMRLVYEAFPTTAELSAHTLIFHDNYPQALVENNTNLYTNPETGDGILKANYAPPFATDINVFKNVTFYSNTKTKYQIPIFQLLGVANIASGDKLTITNGVNTDTYTFVTGVNEVTDITFTAGGTITTNKYFTLYSASDDKIYDFYYVVNGATPTPPVNAGHTPIPVNILSTFTASQVATRTMDVINTLVYDFTAETNTLPKIRVSNINEGKATNGSAGTTPFTVTVITQGNGEDAATKQVLLSSLVSAAQAIDETARSLIRVINKQTDSVVNAYYISGDNTPPGQINLVTKNLSDPIFYIIASSRGLGLSFNPEVSPEHTNITGNTIANPTVVTTSAPHGLRNKDQIVITGSSSTPSIDGLWTVTVLTTTTFTIPVNVTIAGTTAVWSLATDIQNATNEIKPNRVYYSKLNQPDAVPLLNYINVGAEDKSILRIFPLRDSLFVFKQDGLYRISGEVEPFVLALFDGSCILVAPDSVALCDNQVYAWTQKGIVTVNETGAGNNISRPIDPEILKLSSTAYPNFSTITWAYGYDSDNTYTVYTNGTTDDVYANIGFTYSNLTNTWVNVQRTQTCGIVLHTDDKVYMGSGEFNYIEQERKDFTRTDYADNDYPLNFSGGSIFNGNTTLRFTSVEHINIGDAVVQEQTLTIYLFNKILTQLDADPTVTDDNYYSTLAAIPGDDLRLKMEALAVKLDLDPGLLGGYFDRIDAKSGSITSNAVNIPSIVTTSSPHELVNGRIITVTGTQSPQSDPALSGNYTAGNTGTFGASTTFEIAVDVITAGGTGLSYSTASNLNNFEDMKACFNAIVSRLNSDPGATYNSYTPVTATTSFEAVVLDINRNTKRVTFNIPLQWVVGTMRVYNSIPCEVIYAPETMGDTVSSKQIREATVMLESRAITNFSVSFSSDLIPEFFDIFFNGSGNGIFGSYSPPGFGYGFFGGVGNAAPFRTLIPPKIQRCRYILVKTNHNVAREKWVVYGITLTGEVGKSTRSYR